jgi:hypothetical protein
LTIIGKFSKRLYALATLSVTDTGDIKVTQATKMAEQIVRLLSRARQLNAKER